MMKVEDTSKFIVGHNYGRFCYWSKGLGLNKIVVNPVPFDPSKAKPEDLSAMDIFTVLSRTKKYITVQDNCVDSYHKGEIRKLYVHVGENGGEYVFLKGKKNSPNSDMLYAIWDHMTNCEDEELVEAKLYLKPDTAPVEEGQDTAPSPEQTVSDVKASDMQEHSGQFSVGQTYTIQLPYKKKSTWTVVKRTKCYVTLQDGFNFCTCKVHKTDAGVESVIVPRVADILGRSDYVSATVTETGTPAPEPSADSYEVGKQIVSLKGDAKAQQTLVKECGEEFLLNMQTVFPNAAPVRITMETPDELREYLCRDVIRVVRDARYARFLLNTIPPHEDNENLAGWVKFLEEYAAPQKELTMKERLTHLRQCIHETCESRNFHRHYMRILSGTEFEERYAENVRRYTERGKELLKQYRELKASLAKPAVEVIGIKHSGILSASK